MSETKSDALYQFIAGYCILVGFLIINLMLSTSRHVSVAFGISTALTGIYFNKLFSLCEFLQFIGNLISYVLSNHLPVDSKVVALVSIILMTSSRIAYAIALLLPGNLKIRCYYILSSETFGFGIFVMSYFRHAGQYRHVSTLALDSSGPFVFVVQYIIDKIWYHDALLMVRIQAWIVGLMSLIAVPMWYYYLYHKPESDFTQEKPVKKFECKNFKKFDYRYIETDNLADIEPSFGEHFANAFSPFMMLVMTNVFKDLLFPVITPYGLLERDKCHMINMLILPTWYVGSIIIFVFGEYVPGFNDVWPWHLHLLWVFIIPQVVVFVLCILTIHSITNVRKYIVGSKPAVMAMTLTVLFSFSVSESISYSGSYANVKFHGGLYKRGINVTQFFQLTDSVCRFLFSKISVGYNECVNQGEIAINKFHPTYKMNIPEALYYYTKYSLINGYHDTINDFKTSLEDYFNQRSN